MPTNDSPDDTSLAGAQRRRASASNTTDFAEAMTDLPEKASRRPLQIMQVITGVMVAVLIVVVFKFQQPGQGGLITDLGADNFIGIMIAASALSLLAAGWMIATTIWRAQEAQIQSEAISRLISEVVSQLTEPVDKAENRVASLGQAIRIQVGLMNEGIVRALGRAGELEALVHNETANLEKSFAQNEHRIRAMLFELDGQRRLLSQAAEDFKTTLTTLGVEIPKLIEVLREQRINLDTMQQESSDYVQRERTTEARRSHRQQTGEDFTIPRDLAPVMRLLGPISDIDLPRTTPHFVVEEQDQRDLEATARSALAAGFSRLSLLPNP